jgi:nicotinamidase-related amidase
MKSPSFWLVLILVFAVAVPASPNGLQKQPAKLMKPALLVIDIQNEYLPMVPEREKEVALYMINASIELFRENGFPIIRVYHFDLKYGPKPDTEAFEFPKSVPVKPEDPRIIKNYPNAFKKTDLEKVLRDKGCNTLFLCGLSAVGCVLATYHGAADLDFDVFMLKDALMSHNSAYTDSIEDIFAALGYDALKVMLENSQK